MQEGLEVRYSDLLDSETPADLRLPLVLVREGMGHQEAREAIRTLLPDVDEETLDRLSEQAIDPATRYWRLDVVGDPNAPWHEQPEAYVIARAQAGDKSAQAYLDELWRLPEVPDLSDRTGRP